MGVRFRTYNVTEGTLSVTANGTYDVSHYASVNVSVNRLVETVVGNGTDTLTTTKDFSGCSHVAVMTAQGEFLQQGYFQISSGNVAGLNGYTFISGTSYIIFGV